jgi:biopolymer transport protein ExbD
MRTDLRDDEPVEVAMAPLIDCVFLLLIFFLVASTLKKIDKELDLALPEGQRAALEVQQPDDWMILAIDKDGGYYLDGDPSTIDRMQDQVRTRHRLNAALKVRLDADRFVDFEKVMEVLDMLRFEHVEHIGINTQRNPVKGK